MGNATGIDNIPVEVMKNDTAVSFLHVLFNICFDNSIMPSEWGGWLVVLRLNVPVNNFSGMSGRSHRFLGN